MFKFTRYLYMFKCTVNSEINGIPEGVYLPISKIHFILIVPNLLAHNNLWQVLIWASKFATAEIECSFEMGT